MAENNSVVPPQIWPRFEEDAPWEQMPIDYAIELQNDAIVYFEQFYSEFNRTTPEHMWGCSKTYFKTNWNSLSHNKSSQDVAATVPCSFPVVPPFTSTFPTATSSDKGKEKIIDQDDMMDSQDPYELESQWMEKAGITFDLNNPLSQTPPQNSSKVVFGPFHAGFLTR